MNNVYCYPRYYEIAFSFRDIPAEVEVFEECIRRFSRIPVKSILELACGNSPHLEELAKRGYCYTGIDNNPAMLDYARRKADQINFPIELVQGDLREFSLAKPHDFVYILLGSLYVQSCEDLARHFDSVAAALRSGGLYLMDWCITFDSLTSRRDTLNNVGESWEIEKDGTRVKATISRRVLNPAEQKYEETIVLEVSTHGESYRIEGHEHRRAIYPQEFLLFLKGRLDFEFVGWWNNWDLRSPLEEIADVNRPIVLLRRI